MLKKRLILIRKRHDLSLAAFNEHWEGPHAALVRGLPGLKEYVQNPVVRSAGTTSGERSVDGLAELWDDNAADPDTAARVARELREDEPRFLAALTGFSVDTLDSYGPEAKLWIIGDEPFDAGVFTGAVAEAATDGALESHPTNGRLMDSPTLVREPAAPGQILTIGTTRAAGPVVHEAALKAATEAAMLGRVRILLTHSRRIL
ncbi:EthD family reductase [Streptomyces sp. NPDC004250]|uniref:EthD family reductase n=1 Tax=Streptomyces sp. NPDC004250 TaxID=3364692 RepID=UPI0036AB3B99